MAELVEMIELSELRESLAAWTDSLEGRLRAAALIGRGSRFKKMWFSDRGREAWFFVTEAVVDLNIHTQTPQVVRGFLLKLIGLLATLTFLGVCWALLVVARLSQPMPRVALALSLVPLAALPFLGVCLQGSPRGEGLAARPYRECLGALCLWAASEGTAYGALGSLALPVSARPAAPTAVGVAVAALYFAWDSGALVARCNPDDQLEIVLRACRVAAKLVTFKLAVLAVMHTDFTLKVGYYCVLMALACGCVAATAVWAGSGRSESEDGRESEKRVADDDFTVLHCTVQSLPFDGLSVRSTGRLHLPIVDRVQPGSSAERSGVRVGDMLVGVADQPVTFGTWEQTMQNSVAPYDLRFRRSRRLGGAPAGGEAAAAAAPEDRAGHSQ